MKRIAIIFSVLVALFSSYTVTAQTTNYTNGNLSVDVTLHKPCNGALNNGSIQFHIISSEGGVNVNIQRFLPSQGPFSVPVGSTFTFPLTFPATGLVAGNYRFILDDGTNAIDLFSTPLILVNTTPPSDNGSTTTDNIICGVASGTIDVIVTGGSGNYHYSWADAPLLDVANRTGLATASYQVVVSDAESNCTLTLNFTINDPQPSNFSIATSTPVVCAGDNIIVTLGSPTAVDPSELGITYQMRVNGVNVLASQVGDGLSPLTFTLPSASYSSGQIIDFQATLAPCVPKVSTNTLTVTKNSLPTITLGTNPSVCAGATTANLTYSGTTGSPNQYSIDFNAAAEAQGFVDVVNAAFPASPIVITVPGAATPGVYNANLTIRNSGTSCSSLPAAISVTVIANPTITLGTNPTVCSGSTSTSLTYSATTGSPNQYSIDFNAAAEAQGFVDVTNAVLPATPITITVPGGAPNATYNANLIVRNSATGCVSGLNPISITIVANPTITLGANPSVCAGTTSANLTYSATTGTPDQYSIDFNAAAEAQGFVDVVNAVLVASPIVITVPGAASAGTYNATLRVRNSGTTCVSTAAAISVTIIAAPTITLGSNPTVCAGTTTANLSYSATTGTPNQYSIDFNAAAEAQGFVDVVNAALPATPIVITVPGAAVAATYSGTLTVRNSGTGCVSPGNAITVTINSPTITLGASPSVCSGTTTANLTYSATSGSPNQYSIDFNAAAEAQGFVDVVNAVLPASPIVITVPGAAPAATYNANLTVRNTVTGCNSPSSTAITVTIVANPTITLGANPSVCSGSTTANLTYSATTGTPDQFSIDFNAAAEAQGFVDVVNAVLPASPIVITVPGAAPAATYNATLTVRNSGTGCISSSSPISVTINSSSITLGANPSVCSGTTSANLSYSATSGSPNQYSIDFNAAAEAQGFVDVVNAVLPATPIVIVVPGAALSGTYNGSLTVRNTVTGCVSAANAITVTINANPTITLGSNPSVCSGTTTANLTYSATTGSPNQYSIDFNPAAEAQGFVDVVNAALPVTPIAITVPAGASAATYNATLTVRNSATTCSSTSSAISVTIVANPSITLGSNPSVCLGSTSANLTYSATSGSPNQYSIDFNAAAEAQGFVDVVNAVLPASPIVLTVPGAAPAATYNATLTVRNSGTGCFSSSSAITVTVLANPTITLGANPSVCRGITTANLTYSATTGSPNQYSIDFNAAAEAQGFVDVVNSALPASPIVIAVPGAGLAGTYNGNLTVRNTITGCVSSVSPISITITANPTITLGANPSVCSGTTSANLTYSATTGSPNQYSIDFNAAAEAQGFVDVVNAVLPATPIVITVPGGALAATYNASLTVRNSATTCSSSSSAITVTIVANPSITLGANPTVCFGNTIANLAYSATTGSPNQYSIDFNAAAEAQGFVDVVNSALPVSPIAITVPGAAPVASYNATLTVRNSVTGCVSSSSPIIVSVVANPTITLGANPTVCSGSTSASLSFSATSGSPNQYSIDFNAAAEAQGFVDIVNAVLPATPITIAVPGAALAATYNATLTVRNSVTGCISASNPISVTVTGNPTITLGANPSVCAGTTTANLTYSATTGAPDQYSIDFNPAAEAQGFVDVVNAVLPATPIIITVPGAALAATYNATLTVRNSTSTCTSSSSAISVTISPAQSITLGANPVVCVGALSANLSYSSTSGSPNQYSIDFDALAEAQGFVDVVNTALPATPISITVPGAAAGGTYNAVLTVSNSVSGCVSPANAISVTISNPTITLGTNPSVCLGVTTANLPYSATTGMVDQYSIDFDAAAEAQGFVDVVNAVLPATPIVITVPGAALAAVYNATISVRNSTAGCASPTTAITVTIGDPTITLGANPAVCLGATTANLTYSATTSSPDQYSIDFNAAAEAQGFVDVVNAVLPASPIVIVVPGAAVAATYNANLTVRNSVLGCVSTTSPITVTVGAIPTITLGASPTTCVGSTSANLVYSATTGSPDQYSIDYDAAAEAQGFVDVVNAAITASPIILVVPVAAPVASYNATITVRNSVAGCVGVPTAFAVSIVANPTITMGANPTVCGGIPSVGLPYSATTGSPDQYSIDFDAAAEAQGFVDVVNSALPATPIAITIPLAALPATYNATISVRNSTTGCTSGNTAISITKNPVPSTSPITGLNSICAGTSGVSYSVTNTIGSTYAWLITGGTQASGGTTNSITVDWGIAGPGNVQVIETNSVGCAGTAVNLPITKQVIPTATISGTASICTGQSTNLTINLTGTQPWTFTYTDGTTPTTIAAYPLTSLTFGVSPSSTTTYSMVSVTDASGCTGTIGGTAVVTVGSPPAAGLDVDKTIDPVCIGGSSAVTVALSEIGVTYQLRQGVTPVGSSQAGTGGTISLSTGTLSSAGAFVFNVLATRGSCTSVQLTETATINVGGTINGALSVSSLLPTICEGSATSIIIQNAENGVLYQLRNDADNSPMGGPALPGTGANLSLPTGSLSANTTFNILATNGSCSIVLTTKPTVAVDINPDPTLVVSAPPGSLCTGGTASITVQNSEVGVSYQLRDDATNIPSGLAVSGTGGNITLISASISINTTFNVLATSGVCTSVELTTTVNITVSGTIDASLAVSSGAPSVCNGNATTVQVASPEAGVSYTLRNDVDDSIIDGPLSGATITFTTGVLTSNTTFNVLATSGTCSIELTNKVSVIVDQIPDASLDLTGPATSVCSGSLTGIVVKNSQVGVLYQLRLDPSDVAVGAAKVGDGFDISLPTDPIVANTDFNVLATNGACAPVKLTEVITVTMGAGSINTLLATSATKNPICVGQSTLIQILGSELGVNYQLHKVIDDSPVGITISGNGSLVTPISLPTGNLLVTTDFYVLASSGTCSAELLDTETINVNPNPDATRTVTPGPTFICSGSPVNITIATEAGVTYQLRDNADNSLIIGSSVTGNGSNMVITTGAVLAAKTYNILATQGTCSIQLTTLISVTLKPVGDPSCTGCILLPVVIPVSATCNGINDGQIKINSVSVLGAGGVLPYSYSFDNITFTQFDVTDITKTNVTIGSLAGGKSYNLIVKDANGCTSSLLPYSVGGGTALTATINKTDATTCGGADGSITITSPAGSTDPSPTYTFSIDNGATFPGSLPFTSLAQATYQVVVQDNLGCKSIPVPIVISKPASCGGGVENCSLFSSGDVTKSLPYDVKPSCAGDDDGKIIFNITGGTPGYVITLSDDASFGSNLTSKLGTSNVNIEFDGLKPRQYYYRITDAVGNTCTLPFTLDREPSFTVSVDATTSATCFGTSTGTATITVNDTGTSLYEYSLVGDFSDALPLTSGTAIKNLPVGAYTILVRRLGPTNCQVEANVTISDSFISPVTLAAPLAFTDASCNTSDGTITAVLTGGVGTFSYKFGLEGSEADLISYPADNTFRNLATGNGKKYNLIVTDFGNPGCGPYTIPLVEIRTPNGVQYNSIETVNPTCTGGGSDGLIRLSINTNNGNSHEFAITTDPSVVPTAFSPVTSINPVTFDKLSTANYYIWLRSKSTDCPTIVDPSKTILKGAVPITFNVNGIDEKCFGQGGFLEFSNVVGVNSVDFQYDLKLNGVTIPSGTFTYNESRGTLRIGTPFQQGTYEVTLLQPASTDGCVTAPKVTSIKGPLTALTVTSEVVSPRDATSFEDDPTGGQRAYVSGGDPVYKIWLLDAFNALVRDTTEVLQAGEKHLKDFVGLKPGEYTIGVIDAFKCVSKTTKFTIGLKTDIFIPNVFTPNDDPENKNQYFVIRNLAPGSKLVITNRWGNEMYSSNDYQNDWDAKDVSDGIYYYKLLSNGSEYAGWVEVLRGK